MIAIVNYGLGNIKAFANVYKNLNFPHVIATVKEELQAATKIILPGVGAFDEAITLLNNSGLRATLDELVLGKKVPIMGICVGMQMLANSSEEGVLPGLGWIPGAVKKFDPAAIKTKPQLPHMGWNTVKPDANNPLFRSIADNAFFYFLHSYYFQCADSASTVAEAEYGIRFSAAVNKENVYGVQFHPEKSHRNGIQVLRNFANL